MIFIPVIIVLLWHAAAVYLMRRFVGRVYPMPPDEWRNVRFAVMLFVPIVVWAIGVKFAYVALPLALGLPTLDEVSIALDMVLSVAYMGAFLVLIGMPVRLQMRDDY